MSERLEALKIVCNMALDALLNLPEDTYPTIADKAIDTVKEMIVEAEAAEKEPWRKISMAMEVLSEFDADYQIERMLAISTAHVSLETATLLETNSIPQIHPRMNDNYGWFVPVPLPDFKFEGCPDDLKACLVSAQSCGCQWLLLDNGCSEVKTLPTYSW